MAKQCDTEITVHILPEASEGFSQGAAGSFWGRTGEWAATVLSRAFLTGALRGVVNFVVGRSHIRLQMGMVFRGTIIQAEGEGRA
jgi:hypothetical protein